MVLKSLALGAAVAAVTVALFAALSFRPAGATVAAPESNVVVLPNGVASPQLRPAQQGAPALVEAHPSLVGALRTGVARAAEEALALRAELMAPASGSAVHSCGDY